MRSIERNVGKVGVVLLLTLSLGASACGTSYSPNDGNEPSPSCESTSTTVYEDPNERAISDAIGVLCGRLDVSCDKPESLDELRDCID